MIRKLTVASAIACGSVAFAPIGSAQDAPRSATNNALPDEMTPELNAAVDEGLAWLATRQQPDGSFLGGRFGKNVAIASVAALAFMADGHLPGRGEYGEVVERALDFVLSASAENGLIAAEAAHGPMYGHGFATLFLGEIEGMTWAGRARSVRGGCTRRSSRRSA